MAKRKPRKKKPPFTIPSDIYNALGVPAHLRDRVALIEVQAKYCALVEAVLKLTDKPIEVSLERVQQLVDMTADTPIEEQMMVVEEGHLTHDQHGVIRLRLATDEEKRRGILKARLNQMGPSRN